MTPHPSQPQVSLLQTLLKGLGLPISLGLLISGSQGYAFTHPGQLTTSTTPLETAQLLANHDSPTATPSTTTTQTPTNTTTTTTTTASQPRFSCQLVNGQYTVMYHPESHAGQAYAWATPTSLGGGWTPDRRCNEISRRLESYRPDGLLEMQTGVENGYNVICVTTERLPACRIVLTVPPGQDPVATRDSVFQNLTVADSGQQTQGINTFVGGGRDGDILNQLDQALNLGLGNLGSGNPSSGRSRAINLRPFLAPADGGTGAMLRGGMPSRPNPQLNPNRFR